MRALAASSDAVMLTDARLDMPGPRILWTNAALQSLTGYGERDLIGKTPRLFQGSQTDRALLESLKRTLASGPTFHGETINYRKDGRPYWVEWDITAVRDESGAPECFISIQRDVSERKLKEFTLEKMVRALERSNRNLDRYARAVSHDLRSPLQAMQVYAGILQRSAEERLNEKELGYLSTLMEIVDRMGDSIGSMHDLAREKSGPKAFERVDLDGVLADVRVDLSAEVAKSDARIESDPLGVAWGDAALLRLAFQNLLSNAIRFSGPGRTAAVRVYPMPGADDGALGIVFDDNGRGIPEDDAERVFADGYRVSGDDSTGGSGTGLASVRRIVEFCGGRVSLVSKSDPGSRFLVSLPAVVD